MYIDVIPIYFNKITLTIVYITVTYYNTIFYCNSLLIAIIYIT